MPNLFKPFKGNYPVTSGYGMRDLNGDGDRNDFGENHNGIDFGVPENTPLYNLEDGVVVVAGVIDNFNPKSPNLAVGVKADSDGVVAVYMHMNRIDVKVGQRLKGGDMIGLSGNTGYTTGAHLHFGLYSKLWSSTIDPTFLLNQWVEVNNQSNNNNNMFKLPTDAEKDLARKFLETPEIQGLSFNDNNNFGYLRDRIDKPVEEDGQRPYEALKQFGMKSIEMERDYQAKIAALENQLIDKNNKIQELENHIKNMPTVSIDNNQSNNSGQLLEQIGQLEIKNKKLETDKLELLGKIETLEFKINDLQKNSISNKLKSRKLWATICSVVFTVLSVYFPQYQGIVIYVVSSLLGYVGVEGVNDIINSSKKESETIKNLLPKKETKIQL